MDVIKLRGRASQEMFKHKLIGWTFGLEDTGRRLGVCKFNKKHIGISEHYARSSPEENVLDTLMHEIAHAIVGPQNGHNAIWKACASKLGATPRACDTASDTIQKPADWQATCPKCNKVYNKYKRPKQLSGYVCTKCRVSITFVYAGNPALKPVEPTTMECWETTCSGCGKTFRRLRKPKRMHGWQCKCSSPSYLTWRKVQVAVKKE